MCEFSWIKPYFHSRLFYKPFGTVYEVGHAQSVLRGLQKRVLWFCFNTINTFTFQRNTLKDALLSSIGRNKLLAWQYAEWASLVLQFTAEEWQSTRSHQQREAERCAVKRKLSCCYPQWSFFLFIIKRLRKHCHQPVLDLTECSSDSLAPSRKEKQQKMLE